MTGTAIYANNATSTLAGSISNVATTLAVSAGTGALFPNPGAGEYFSITMVAASNPNLREIIYCGARSGDTLSSLVRGQEGTSAIGWTAGDLVKHLVTAGDLNGMQQTANSRIRLNGPLTVFANISSGNDANDGLTSGIAVQHLQVAIEIALTNYDAGGGHIITVQLADGVYATTNASVGVIAGAIPGSAGSSSLIIQGNVVTPANVTLTATNGASILASGNTFVTLTGMTLLATGAAPAGNAIAAIFNSIVTIGPAIVFGACDASHNSSGTGAVITASADYTISGSAPSHWNADAQGQINMTGLTLTITGTPAFSTAFAAANRHGTIYVPSMTFSGAATGNSWEAADLGLIYTGTAGTSTYLPGNHTGTPASGATLGTTGGLYD